MQEPKEFEPWVKPYKTILGNIYYVVQNDFEKVWMVNNLYNNFVREKNFLSRKNFAWALTDGESKGRDIIQTY